MRLKSMRRTARSRESQDRTHERKRALDLHIHRTSNQPRGKKYIRRHLVEAFAFKKMTARLLGYSTPLRRAAKMGGMHLLQLQAEGDDNYSTQNHHHWRQDKINMKTRGDFHREPASQPASTTHLVASGGAGVGGGELFLARVVVEDAHDDESVAACKACAALVLLSPARRSAAAMPMTRSAGRGPVHSIPPSIPVRRPSIGRSVGSMNGPCSWSW